MRARDFMLKSIASWAFPVPPRDLGSKNALLHPPLHSWETVRLVKKFGMPKGPDLSLHGSPAVLLSFSVSLTVIYIDHIISGVWHVVRPRRRDRYFPADRMMNFATWEMLQAHKCFLAADESFELIVRLKRERNLQQVSRFGHGRHKWDLCKILCLFKSKDVYKTPRCRPATLSNVWHFMAREEERKKREQVHRFLAESEQVRYKDGCYHASVKRRAEEFALLSSLCIL